MDDLKLTRADDSDLTRLRVEGSLDANTAPELREVIEAVIEAKRMRVQVDCSALRLIDSSGVGALVALYKRLKQYGGSLQILGLRDQPLAILKLLRLDRILGT